MSAKSKYKRTIKQAKQRGLDFSLDFETYQKIISQGCFYCGENKNNNLDRKDNSKGYVLENVVPCCPDCNFSKRKRSVNAFISHCFEIVKRHVKNEDDLWFIANSLAERLIRSKETFTTTDGDVAILHTDYIKPEHIISEEEICKAHQEQD